MHGIIKNRAIPNADSQGGRNRIYPWDQMKKGDSFDFSANHGSVRSSFHYFKEKTGAKWKISIRGQSCWRVS